MMMLSRGVRTLDGVKLVIPHGYSRRVEKIVGFEVSDDESMKFCKFKDKSEVGLKKDSVNGSGSGQYEMGRVGSTIEKCKSTKKPKSTDQDFTDSEISVELKRKSKDYKCPICFKGYVSIQGLARHERAHNKIESKVESDHIHDIQGLVDININKDDVVLSWFLKSFEPMKQKTNGHGFDDFVVMDRVLTSLEAKEWKEKEDKEKNIMTTKLKVPLA
ncbi:hypothetical protein L2E82_44156 [Cichorium intybus]|uniref:Uncharacterized protein n=1 Tax=Cichorium intybus TaxID=13427 RepID=A0ACB8ZUB1_CICIN|nr:hypothetical protein L2E82_44156 [Cichorium intybus]